MLFCRVLKSKRGGVSELIDAEMTALAELIAQQRAAAQAPPAAPPTPPPTAPAAAASAAPAPAAVPPPAATTATAPAKAAGPAATTTRTKIPIETGSDSDSSDGEDTTQYIPPANTQPRTTPTQAQTKATPAAPAASAAPAPAAQTSAEPPAAAPAAAGQNRVPAAEQGQGGVFEQDNSAQEADRYREMGNAFFKQGRLEPALNAYDASLAQMATAAAHANKALVLLRLGRPAEAEAACVRALELDSVYIKAKHRRAKALVQLGRPAEAVPLLEEVGLHTHTPHTHTHTHTSPLPIARARHKALKSVEGL